MTETKKLLHEIYTPLHQEVIVKLPTKEEREKEKMKGKIITSAERKQNEYVYEVLAVSPLVKQVAVGDKVLLRSNAIIAIVEINGEEFGSLTDFQIIGKLLQ